MSDSFIRHSLLRFESVRESTFSMWKEKSPTPEELSKAGFYYLGYSTFASCFSCGVSFCNWMYPKIAPLELHKKVRPDCLFLKGIDFSLFAPISHTPGEIDLPIQTYLPLEVYFPIDPKEKDELTDDIDIYHPKEKIARTLEKGPNLTIPITAYTRIPPAPKDSTLDVRAFLILMRSEKHRLETFITGRWSHSSPTKEEMAAAAFYHLQISDYTQCPFCLLIVAAWDKMEKGGVFQYHRDSNPTCPYVKGKNVGNIPHVLPMYK